jgi:o-succinylbenzoate synthase
MSLQASVEKRIFHFAFDARTSRGLMKEKTSWLIRIGDPMHPEQTGWGECGPLPGLSPELTDELPEIIEKMVGRFNNESGLPATSDLADVNKFILTVLTDEIENYPSVRFAFETALLDYMNGCARVIFKNEFAEGKPIPINGLIWMGGLDFMLQQIEIKIRDGFNCVKLKVGGFDFEKECDVLQYIRRKYFRSDIMIRLDANGAFKPSDIDYKLHELAKFNVHSIEQPLKPGSVETIELCKKSPIPIALDEELIGVNNREGKEQLLDRIRPSFIILKPTLHGGLWGCQEWIEAAEKRNTGWWITSALESNIGLNAIAQFTAGFPISIHQGLGTGQIYTDNIESPLSVNKGRIFWDKRLSWELS